MWPQILKCTAIGGGCVLFGVSLVSNVKYSDQVKCLESALVSTQHQVAHAKKQPFLLASQRLENSLVKDAPTNFKDVLKQTGSTIRGSYVLSAVSDSERKAYQPWKPNDIDVCVPKERVGEFHNYLNKAGYRPEDKTVTDALNHDVSVEYRPPATQPMWKSIHRLKSDRSPDPDFNFLRILYTARTGTIQPLGDVFAVPAVYDSLLTSASDVVEPQDDNTNRLAKYTARGFRVAGEYVEEEYDGY